MKWPLFVYPGSVNRYHNEVYDVYSIIFTLLGMQECISNGCFVWCVTDSEVNYFLKMQCVHSEA